MILEMPPLLGRSDGGQISVLPDPLATLLAGLVPGHALVKPGGLGQPQSNVGQPVVDWSRQSVGNVWQVQAFFVILLGRLCDDACGRDQNILSLR